MMYDTLRIFYYAEVETENKQKQMHIIYGCLDKNFNTTSFMILMCCFCYIYGKT